MQKRDKEKKQNKNNNNNNNKNVEKRKYFILFNHSISVIAPRRNAQTSRAPDQPAHINAVFPEILNGCFIFAHLNECQNKVLDNNTSGISLQGVSLALQQHVNNLHRYNIVIKSRTPAGGRSRNIEEYRGFHLFFFRIFFSGQGLRLFDFVYFVC